MNCEEVKISLHDFMDDLLDEKRRKEIEDHLRICNNCFAEYKRIKKFFDKLKNMPYTIEPPANIITALSEELLKKAVANAAEEKPQPKVNIRKIKREQVKQEKILKKTRGTVRKSRVTKSVLTARTSTRISSRAGLEFQKTIFTLLPLVIIAAGYFIYDFTLINSPWKVRTITGKVLVNGQLNISERWEENESLVTDSFSKAVVNVPGTARIEVNSNSFLILQKAKDKQNRIKISKGKLRVINNSLMPYLSIEADHSVIHDRGGTFEIAINDNTTTSVEVEYGYLEIEQKGRNYFIDKGYTCDIRQNYHPGTPYRIDASEELKNEVRKFDYENGGDNSVQQIISLSTESDMLTLLSLIERVSSSYRSILFSKIAAYFPPPAKVTLEGIIKLDRDMLEQWWFEIEWQI